MLRKSWISTILCLLAVSTASAQTLVVDKDTHPISQPTPAIPGNAYAAISGVAALLPGETLYIVTRSVCDASQIALGQTSTSTLTDAVPVEPQSNKLIIKKFDNLEISATHDLTAKEACIELGRNIGMRSDFFHDIHTEDLVDKMDFSKIKI